VTRKGQSANVIQTLLKVDVHQFREKGLCSSANYHADLIDAMREFAALPRYTSREVMDAHAQGIRLHGDIRGFFYEPMPEVPCHGIHNSERGGASNFTHHNRRYRQGWDAGKPDDEDS
jgi:hypothetical protein